jgi:hypothetical protein
LAIIQAKPLKIDPTMTSMKITLAEKPKLIPSTPPPPATLEGSLQPSQAITAGAFAKTAPIKEARNSRIKHSVLFRSVAQSINPNSSDKLPTELDVRRAKDFRHRPGCSEQALVRKHRILRGFHLARQSIEIGFAPAARAGI